MHFLSKYIKFQPSKICIIEAMNFFESIEGVFSEQIKKNHQKSKLKNKN